MKTILQVAMLATVFVVSFACKKEVIQGVQGANGPAGEKGQSGLASTDLFLVNDSDWESTGTVWSMGFTVPAITEDIVNNGAVMVYTSDQSATNWVALPATFVVDASYSATMNFSYGEDTLNVFWQQTNNNLGANPGDRKFKVVCFEGSEIQANPDVDLTNFNEVVERFDVN